MDKIEGSSKANTILLLSELMNTKYDGQGSVRKHIMGLVDIRDKLKTLNYPLNDDILLHNVFLSFPLVFEPFKINHNGGSPWMQLLIMKTVIMHTIHLWIT